MRSPKKKRGKPFKPRQPIFRGMMMLAVERKALVIDACGQPWWVDPVRRTIHRVKEVR